MNSKTRGEKKEVLINVFEVVSKDWNTQKIHRVPKIIPHFSHRNKLQDLELSGPFSAARLHEY